MAARGFGRVVNIASDAGRVGSSGEAVYSACKGGIIAFAKTMARELVSKGIIVNTLCPGPTDTAILRSFLEGPDGAQHRRRPEARDPDAAARRAGGLSRAWSRSSSPTTPPTSPARPSASRAASPCTDDARWPNTRTSCSTCATASRGSPSTGRRSTTPSPRETCEELIDAFRRAGYDKSVAVIVLAGAGDKAFCTGADQSAHEGAYEGRGTIGLPIDEVQSLIRDVPKPVIARVQGFAIGGGNVLATLCDLTIASEKAVFGQVGPKVGSVDPGFGTAYLARLVGEKRAREIWYLCRRYTAKEASTWAWSTRWCRPTSSTRRSTSGAPRSGSAARPRSPSPSARSTPTPSNLRGIGALGFEALALFYGTEESKEGGRAFREKRPPKFR